MTLNIKILSWYMYIKTRCNLIKRIFALETWMDKPFQKIKEGYQINAIMLNTR